MLLFVGIANDASGQKEEDLSTPAGEEGWQSWLLFLLLAAVHLVDVGQVHSREENHRAHVVANHLIRGSVLCCGIVCLHLRRNFALDSQPKSDFYFFRSFCASAGDSGVQRYVLQAILLLWLGLLASRWFEEMCRCIFFRRCCLPECSKTRWCIRCYSIHIMKEDVDDACTSLAVAGIFLGAYAISPSPLPEQQQHTGTQQHSFIMLAVLGIAAAVITGVHLVNSAAMLAVLQKHQQSRSTGSAAAGYRGAAAAAARGKQHAL